jgi:hypothetical protein
LVHCGRREDRKHLDKAAGKVGKPSRTRTRTRKKRNAGDVGARKGYSVRSIRNSMFRKPGIRIRGSGPRRKIRMTGAGFPLSIFSRAPRLTSPHPALTSRRQDRNFPERHSRPSAPAEGQGIFPSRWFTAILGPFSDAQQKAVPIGRAPNRTGESEGRIGLFGNSLSRSN